jgi:ribosomal protein L7/L12
MEKQVTSEAKKEVERLVRQGQKLQAIKYLMDTFGTTLDESKTLTETVELEIAAETAAIPPNIAQVSASRIPANLRAEVFRLLQAKKKIDAIKLVKKELNTGLKEAAELVEEVEKEINPNYRSVKVNTGCIGGGFKLVGIFFGLIGFLLIAVAGIIYYFQSETIENSDRVTGVVIGFETSGNGTAPVIAYSQNGQQKQYSSSTYSSPPAYELNEEVPLFVNRDNPDDVVVDTFSDRWLLIVVFGGIGAVFALFTVLFLFVGRKF